MFQSLREKLSAFKKKLKSEALEDAPDKKGSKKSGGAKKKGKVKVGKKKSKASSAAADSEGALLDGYEGGWIGKKISEKKLEDVMWDLELALLESDVALPVVEEIKKHLKKELVGRKIQRKFEIDDVIESALKRAIINVLRVESVDFDAYIQKHDKPVVLMFVGINGTGKTTTIAKIAHRLKQIGYQSVIAASDTFRAGAIEQLERHSTKLGVKLIKHQKGSDPAAIAYDSIEHAKARRKEVVLIDTAGRMQTNINLMDEMKKLKRIANPDMIIFVGDALSGNDAIEQAIQFDKTVNIDTAILTKIDADAKGGAALSIAHAVGKPIIFVGTGQEYSDIEIFNPNWMVERLFGTPT
jgi:fused signal recognition particle receptor